VILSKNKVVRSYVLDYFYRKITKDGEDVFVVVTGKKGKGKSFASIRLGEVFSGEYTHLPFSIGTNVKHTVKGLLRLVNSGDLPEGSVIVMEEVGVGANARDFMKQVNKALNFLSQTIRFRHYMIIFNVPNWGLIDKSLRVLSSARIEMLSKNKKEGYSRGKLYLLDYDDYNGKEWRRFLRLKWEGVKRLGVVKDVYFGLPSDVLIREYLEKKENYSNQLYKDLERSIDFEFGDIESESEQESGDVLDHFVRLYNEFKLSRKQICGVLGINVKGYRHYTRLVKEKGLVLKGGKRMDDLSYNAKGRDYFLGLLQRRDAADKLLK